MRIDILTLFPEMFASPLNRSILRRAQDKGLVTIRLHNFRRFAKDKHHTVDDTPYGGGAGMVLKPEPIFSAVEYLREKNGSFPLFYLSPKGKVFNQKMAYELSKMERFALLCGRYEGVDQRVIDNIVDEEISIGDYILSGGEPAAIVIIDAVVRLVKGVLGEENSSLDESFSGNLLEYSHYTKPRKFRDFEVPDVLVSGNHKSIKDFREKSSFETTLKKRPDLLKFKGEANG